MKSFRGKFREQRGASAGGAISLLFGFAILVVGSVIFYSYAMEIWRVNAMIAELKGRSGSILQSGSLNMQEFPDSSCQGFPIKVIEEQTAETVYLLRVQAVNGEICRKLLERYPSDWFYVFVNNQLDKNRETPCNDLMNTLDFAFMKEREKPLPDCFDVHCYNGGTCLRGMCTCPSGVTGALCTRANDCTDKENGTRCSLAGRNFDGVCVSGLCQNEGECPELTWTESALFCQEHGGLPEVGAVYGVSEQLVDSNSDGYWMSYLKNPQTRDAYRHTACFTDNAVVWTKETLRQDASKVWTVELHSGHVVHTDKKARHQVLCAEALAQPED